MKVYLAARYSRYPEMQGYAAQLTECGHEVTARWILGDHELRADGQSDADEWAVRWAQEDWDDLVAADVVISFTEGPTNVPGRARGGRHVEFGAALALRKRVIVVGYRENVFHHLPHVEFAADWEAALALVRPICRQCGCTDEDGCLVQGGLFAGFDLVGCSWVEPALCSGCAQPILRVRGPMIDHRPGAALGAQAGPR